MTPLQREALQMCLEYIETDAHERRHVRWKINEALAEQTAQPQQEPVAWRSWNDNDGYGFWETKQEAEPWCAPDFFEEPLYTSPPARKPLTDEQKLMCWARATYDADVEHKTEHQCLMDYATEIEEAHNIKEKA